MRVLRLAPAVVGAVLVATPLHPLFGQLFEGVLGMRIREVPSEIQAFVKGNKVRMELATPAGPGAFILNPAGGENYLVLHSQQLVMVMKTADLAQVVDSLAKARGVGKGELVVTGRKDHVAGHDCQIHRFQDREGVMDLCLASGLGKLGGAAALFGNPTAGMGAMGGMGGGRARAGPGSGAPAWARELARKGRFPLRVADSAGTVHWQVTSLERKRLDDSLFAPPAAFQRMDMPGFGRRPPRDRSR